LRSRTEIIVSGTMTRKVQAMRHHEEMACA
jgi:hypothetical protein